MLGATLVQHLLYLLLFKISKVHLFIELPLLLLLFLDGLVNFECFLQPIGFLTVLVTEAFFLVNVVVDAGEVALLRGRGVPLGRRLPNTLSRICRHERAQQHLLVFFRGILINLMECHAILTVNIDAKDLDLGLLVDLAAVHVATDGLALFCA